MDDKTAEFCKKQTEFEQEVQRYAESDDIGSVVEQLALAKALCSEVVRNAATPADRQKIMPQVRDCLKVIGSLSNQFLEMQARSGAMIHRSELDKFTDSLTALFCEVLEEAGIPDYETRVIDKVIARLAETLPETAPPRKKQR